MKLSLIIALSIRLLIQNFSLYPCSQFYSESAYDCVYNSGQVSHRSVPYQRAAVWRAVLNRQKNVRNEVSGTGSQRFCEEYLPTVSNSRYLSREKLYRYLQRACHGNIACYRHHLLHLHEYYCCPAFIQIIQEFPEYSGYITRLYQKERNANWFTRTWHSFTGFSDTISTLYAQVQHQRKCEKQRDRERRVRESTIARETQRDEHEQRTCQQKQRRDIEGTLAASYTTIEHEIVHAPRSTDDEYNNHLAIRADALARYAARSPSIR